MDLASTKRLNILVVEDDMIDRKGMQRLLAASSLPINDVVFVDCLHKAATALDEGEFDILLLDLNLPDSSGLETLVALERSHPNVTKIVVTGEGDEELGLKAVATGAQDYLVKGRFNVDAITRVIHYSVERKKLEEALRQSRGKLNAMLESISDPVIMADQDLNVIWSNEAVKHLFGDDRVGKKCYQINASQKTLCGPSPCIASQTFEDGKPHSCDICLVDTEGLKRFFHCTANVALRDKNGHPTAVMEVASDITDRRITEKYNEHKRMEAANCELKQLQSHLVQSEKLASIGQLAAGVAHEMNTPVGFVACNFETLQKHMQKISTLLEMYAQLERTLEGGDRAAGVTMVEQIKAAREKMRFEVILKNLNILFEDSRQGLERVTEIIQNLRDFSRVDQSGEFARYNVNDGLRATLTVARNAIKYKAEVETEFADLPDIFCNPGQINQVFLNILVNAAHAIESQERQSKGLIKIRTYTTETDVVCEIDDDGPGISPDNCRKVFDPFFTTKPPGKGTGMGLSISYDIVVNKHKGQIWVESGMGQGTLFTIKLPVRPTQDTGKNSRSVLTGAENNG